MNSIKDEGLVTQLAVVATMMPKVKQYIDELLNENEAFKLNFYNTGYELQLKDKDETIRQQADEIIKLKLEWQCLTTQLEEYSLLYGAK